MRHDDQDQIIVSESGIESAEQIRYLKTVGAKAFLIGTMVMSAPNIEKTVKELVEA